MKSKKIQEFFERVASDWLMMRLAYYDESVVERMAEATCVDKSSVVVDVGTGAGFAAAGLAPAYERWQRSPSANRVGALVIPYLILDEGKSREEAVEIAEEVGVDLGAAVALEDALALVGVAIPAEDIVRTVGVGDELSLLVVELTGTLEDGLPVGCVALGGGEFELGGYNEGDARIGHEFLVGRAGLYLVVAVFGPIRIVVGEMGLYLVPHLVAGAAQEIERGLFEQLVHGG